MIREERLKTLSEYVDAHRIANIAEMMSCLGVSKATVRRDLIELERRGRIRFVRGGAATVRRAPASESLYRIKEQAFVEEKKRIGAAAAKLLGEGDCSFLYAGTSVRAMVPCLPEAMRLTVVTNDLMIAADLSARENTEVTVTGGQLRQGYYALRGYRAEETVAALKLDIAFLGCDAVDPENGCYIANADEVGLLRRIIGSAARRVVLADHSKFGAGAFFNFCVAGEIDTLITDSGLEESTAALVRKAGIRLILV